MNREETRKAAEVMMHYANGGEVQVWSAFNKMWINYRGEANGRSDVPRWDWHSLKYRIKPEPIEVVCYAVLQNGSHDGFFFKRSMAEKRCIDLREIGRQCAIVELKGTYTCDT